MNIPIYNCLIEDTDDTTGVYAMSFVDCPANEVDFVALREQKQVVQLSRDNHKQILTGVVLQPEQLIYRNSQKLGEHYIKFSEEQIERIAHKMMRTGLALHNTTHQHEQELEGNYLIELWTVHNPQTDKSAALGFKNLPKGTLMCSYKVENADYWQQEVMTGHVKGFSLEGFFNQQIEVKNAKNQSKQKYEKMNDRKKKKTLLGRLANVLLDIQDVQKKDSTASGEPYVIFVLSDGKEIFIDEDGFATMDDEQMAAGDHILADGNTLVIDKDGQFVETIGASDKKTKPEEATPAQTLRRNAQRQRLAEFDPKNAQALKAKIAEMQSTIDQLAQSLTDAQAMLEGTKSEVEEMRRRTPSSQPLKQSMAANNVTNMSTTERMAAAVSQTMNLRK